MKYFAAGQSLGAVNPKSDEAKLQNISKVIEFMKSNGIKLHHVTAEGTSLLPFHFLGWHLM